jgi:hypothetical protein
MNGEANTSVPSRHAWRKREKAAPEMIRAAFQGRRLFAASLLADHKSVAGGCDCAGLAGHRAAKTLALQRGRDVRAVMTDEEAGKESHDTSPCSSHGVPSQIIQEWGISVDTAYVVIPLLQCSRKSEAVYVDCDMA